jgi:hydroxymethylglutaryl-CoA lyase
MSVKIIECPRDAMQGMEPFIPTEQKAKYINQLLRVGFDTIDFGSFVSPKAIPQLRDTTEVLSMLDLENTNSKLLAIVANSRGAQDACNFEEIDYLGYPFSISETFQLRNTNATIEQSLSRVEEMHNLCVQNNKKMVVYISMAFGNPYGDPWSGQLAAQWTEKLTKDLGIEIIALADTVGVSNGENITELFSTLIPEFPSVEIGAHLHTLPEDAQAKAMLAYNSGCRRFDAAVKGYGGCPMAEDDLVGNMATELLIDALKEVDQPSIDEKEFSKAMLLAGTTFPL